MNGIDAGFLQTVYALEDVQVDFDFVDEGALDADPALVAHARTEGPRLVLGRQKYRIVVLPQTPILALGAARMLTRFVRAGGTLVAIGELPTEEAHGDHEGLRRELDQLFTGPRPATRAADPAAAAAAVVAAGGAAALLDPPRTDVRVLRLERGRERGFVVTNDTAAAIEITARFPATGVPEIWDPDTGTVAAPSVWDSSGDGTAVFLRLDPKATLLVVFRTKPEPAHAVSATAPVEHVRIHGGEGTATVRVSAPGAVSVTATDGRRRYQGSVTAADPLDAIPLDGDWTFRFDRPDAPTTVRPLGSWTTVDSSHSGSAWYETNIEVDAATLADRRWTLDLGDVRDVAEITINGTVVGSRLWTPYRADVTDALWPGSNVVSIRVTNTGANTRGQALPSGLLGPVFLRPSRLIDVPLAPV
jgi:hypothetical protein